MRHRIKTNTVLYNQEYSTITILDYYMDSYINVPIYRIKLKTPSKDNPYEFNIKSFEVFAEALNRMVKGNHLSFEEYF